MTRKSKHCAVWLVSLALLIPMGLSGQEEGDTYEVGTALPPVDPGRTLVEITVEDAIERALEMNLNIQTARLNPQIQRYSLQAAEWFPAAPPPPVRRRPPAETIYILSGGRNRLLTRRRSGVVPRRRTIHK